MTERDERTRQIHDRLGSLRDPASGQDLAASGMLEHVSHCDGAVKVTLRWAGAPAAREALEGQIRQALSGLEEVEKVTVAFEAPTGAPPGAAHESGGIRHIVAVASGKGGVGKSTVAANLAVGMARAGRSVGLLDADVYGPSIPLMLGVRGQPAVIEQDGRKLLSPLEAHGVKLMSMGFLVEDDRPVIWRGPMLHGALKQFFNDVDWGDLDCLVVDLPPGTGDVALTMVQTIQLSGAIIVSTPQNVAMLDARKALAMFQQTEVHILGIVENMAGDVFGQGGCRSWAGEQGVPFLGSIPLDGRVRVGGDEGRPAILEVDGATGQGLQDLVQGVQQALDARGAEPARPNISIQR